MDIQHLFVAGVNYKKTDISIRGKFALSGENYQAVLNKAADLDYKDLFILSTCNRTEIYGIAHDANELIQILCAFTEGDESMFHDKCYIKNGCLAAEHLFNVAAGLDSQILGDYEIVGQLKQSIKAAKEKGLISAFMERLSNTVFQASKAIKNTTKLSGGTISVSFAAIQYLRSLKQDFSQKKIVLIGAGKIGESTCKNLIDYLHCQNITIINRTIEKAKRMATELHMHYAPYENYIAEVQDADIIIVATNSKQPILSKKDLSANKKKILIDLSVPNNIDDSAKEIEGIKLMNVDELSKINDETLQKREAEIPKAQSIIHNYAQEFYEWYQIRRQAPYIRTAKEKMQTLTQNHPHDVPSTHNDTAVKKAIKSMALKLREKHSPGCIYLETINDFIGNIDFPTKKS